MRATTEELAYLDRLLALLAGGYRAHVDAEDEETVLVEYRGYCGGVPSHLSLAVEGNAWVVICAVVSGNSRLDPPDVDVYDACPAAPWRHACRNLLAMLVDDLADAVDDAAAE